MTKKHSQINIHIDQLDILENQFDHNKLSYDFNEYINYQLLGIPLSELIQINIHSKQKISEREQEQFISKFVQHYEHQITSYDFASKYIFRKVLILFLIGIFFITLYATLDSVLSFVIPEVLLITGWVAIWEAVYAILFTDSQNRMKAKRARQLKKSKIIFSQEKTEE